MYHDHDQGPIEVALLYFVLTPLVGQYLCMLYITCMESKTPVERNKCREKCKSVYSGFIHKSTLSHFVIKGFLGWTAVEHAGCVMNSGLAVFFELALSGTKPARSPSVNRVHAKITFDKMSAHRQSNFPPTHPEC